MDQRQKEQAKRMAERLYQSYREGSIRYGEAINVCASCVDSKVGQTAYYVFKGKVKNVSQ